MNVTGSKCRAQENPGCGQILIAKIASDAFSNDTFAFSISSSRHIRPTTQRIADFSCQIGLAIRLVEQRDAGIEPAMVHDGIFSVAGRIEHVE